MQLLKEGSKDECKRLMYEHIMHEPCPEDFRL